RDSVLVLATASYVIGYGIWSIYAWQFGLGPRPASQMQYFVAGTPPLAAAALLAALLRWPPKMASGLARRLVGRIGRRIALGAAPLVAALLFLAHGRLLPAAEFTLVGFSVGAVYFLLLGLDLRLRDPSHIALFAVVPLVFLYLYAAIWYPEIPKALGGGRPECVVLWREGGGEDYAWQKIARESRSRGLSRLQRSESTPPPSNSRGNMVIQDELDRLASGSAPKNVITRSGSLLLWMETDSALVVSSGRRHASSDTRFSVPRYDSLVIE